MNLRKTRYLVGGLLLAAVPALAAGLATADPPEAAQNRHDVIFLAEARPVLLRLSVEVDGKPLEAAWNDFVHFVFSSVDRDGDGTLNADEVKRIPPADQILSGGIGRAFGGLGGGFGKNAPLPTFADLDTNKDGRVSEAELGQYYRAHGLAALQLQPDTGGANPLGASAILTGRRPDPKVEEVAEAIFARLDTNGDGKLTRNELAAAPTVLLRLDTDDDEMLTAVEIAPDAKASTNALAGMMAMNMGGAAGGAKGPKNLLLLPAPGTAPPAFAVRLRTVYAPEADKGEEPRLTRQQLGLDEPTFARLDANHDGVLDAAELAGLVKGTPQCELVCRLGRREFGATQLSVAAGKAQTTGDVVRLDLGRTRVDFRTNNSNSRDQIGGILRQQFLAQFKQADKANNGYLDEKSARANRTYSSLFHAMDRDGDGKLYESEVIAYLDELAELQHRARTACASLALVNQSRGLFDLLDTNRDGRLGVRELRGAVKLLETLNTTRKGYLQRSDLPHSYQLTLRRGPVSAGGAVGIADLYRVPDRPDTVAAPTAGPLWFRKMDRNHDGDVSRREFLGADEQFRQIDADGDGLISAEEADRFDVLQRKQGQ